MTAPMVDYKIHWLKMMSVPESRAVVGRHHGINGRDTKIDGRTTRHPGYGVSQRCRKRIEEVFGWVKTSAGLSKTKFRGRHRVDASFTLALAAYNLVRLPRLLAEAPT